MDVNVRQSRSVVCGSARESLTWFAEKVYHTPVRQSRFLVIPGRASGRRFAPPMARTRNPEPERHTSGFRVRAKTRAAE
jgi:hypothetical protein